MTDAEREAQLRERAKGRYLTDNEFLLLRLLDEARARINEGEAIVIAQRLEITEARAEIARRTAPPGASAMERAKKAAAEVEADWITRGDKRTTRKLMEQAALRCGEQAERDAREEAAKIADLYAERPPSGDHNNTRAAFDAGMDHRAGATDAAMCIADAIRALNTDNKTPAG